MTPPVSRTRTPRPGRVLLATLMAVCWAVLPAAPPAHADARLRPGAHIATPALTPGGSDQSDEGDTTADDSGGGAVDTILPVAVLCVVAAVAAYTYVRRRKRVTTRTTPVTGAPSRDSHPEPPAPLRELSARADDALVATDNAVRTSAEELGHATDRSGDEATTPFADAVARAGDELATAFRIRGRLDDAPPQDAATRRRMLDEIVGRCADADRRLDAMAEDFDALRALERDAPRALAAVETTFRALTGRVSAAGTALVALRDRYAEPVRAPLTSAAERAKDRLVFATSALNRARQAVDADDGGAAAAYVRAAESAVGQATTLVDAVDRRVAELVQAARLLAAALADTDTDLTEANGLLAGLPDGPARTDLRVRAARAASVLAAVRSGTETGPYDPVDALRRVTGAGAALDEALARAGEPGGRRVRRELLEQALFTARAAAGAAMDHIDTHRGAVGGRARTLLAEAGRRLERSGELASADDARGALDEAHRADALGAEALDVAERDVRSYQDRYGQDGQREFPAGGGVDDPRRAGHAADGRDARDGGSHARDRGSADGGLAGAVLGGIVLPGPYDDEGGGSGGPASFGGGSTRGRRGGGGRF
ncbi:TPM domain-containing protein [Streptomyces sp. DT171]|uniref:TPM domain-containing protein n=1 Tax=Streptomyces sp. DT171 TaxID=3416524 RepID=UPI003CEFD56B